MGDYLRRRSPRRRSRKSESKRRGIRLCENNPCKRTAASGNLPARLPIHPMTIPFVKAHGAGNDFLFTFSQALIEPLPAEREADLARAICSRNTGIGADGWYLIVQPSEGNHAEIRLYNSDGSKAELSG